MIRARDEEGRDWYIDLKTKRAMPAIAGGNAEGSRFMESRGERMRLTGNTRDDGFTPSPLSDDQRIARLELEVARLKERCERYEEELWRLRPTPKEQDI